jgi:hypothetical protein
MTKHTATSMVNALTAMERFVTELGAAYATYRDACLDGQRAEYAARGRTDDYEHAVGLERVDKALAARMAELGLGSVLDQPHLSAVGSDWTSSFSGHITRMTS